MLTSVRQLECLINEGARSCSLSSKFISVIARLQFWHFYKSQNLFLTLWLFFICRSVDQICSNVASSQLDPLSVPNNLLQISRTTRSIIPPTFTSPISSLSTASTPEETTTSAEGALNLSISNRSSPSTSSTSLLDPLPSPLRTLPPPSVLPPRYHSQVSHPSHISSAHSPAAAAADLSSHPPTTRATSLPCALKQLTASVEHRESWPPDSFRGAYRDPHDSVRGRRDSAVSTTSYEIYALCYAQSSCVIS